ncbi:MAG: hypothetical protein V1736_07380 [Pseudomonadota bacterium]
MKTFVCIWVMVLSLFLANDVPAEQPDWPPIRAKNDELMKRLPELRETHDYKPIEKAVVSLDEDIQAAIAGLFEHRNFETIKSLTKNVFKWCEWPLNITLNKRARMDESDKAIRIIYRNWKNKAGTELYLLANSFLNTYLNGRIEANLYSITLVDGKAKLSQFDPVLPEKTISFFGNPVCFLGFLESQSNNLPRIAVLYGPDGSGAFVDIYIYSYNKETNRWGAKKLWTRMSGVRDFAYDEEKAELQYTTTKLLKDTRHYVREEKVYKIPMD